MASHINAAMRLQWSSRLALLIASITLSALSSASPQSYQGQLPVVDLGYRLQRAAAFNDTGRYYNFSNIRYAAPPLGENRFRAPKEPEVDRSVVHDGLNEGRVCPQSLPAWYNIAPTLIFNYLTGRPVNVSATTPGNDSSLPLPPQDPRTSEDCLFLDVIVPQGVLERARRGQPAPVLVWIYGGGYVVGSKTDGFNPIGLFERGEQNLVYVAMNYRLGAFGWLSGPTLQADGDANAGLRDQRFALEWVQKHIHLFGGDPKKVTVMGESAGGGSIVHQITAFGGKKGPVPFQQAIPQSPGWVNQPSRRQQEDQLTSFIKLANVTSLQELRRLPTETLLLANDRQVRRAPYGGFVYGPTEDGDFTPASPGELLLHGQYDRSLRVLVGHNGNEGLLFTPFTIENDAQFREYIAQRLVPAQQSAIDYIAGTLYPPIFDGSRGYRTQLERTSLVIAETAFSCNSNYLGRAFGNGSVFGYLFNVPPALHGEDIPYTFWTGGNTTTTPPPTAGVQNATVAVALQEFITSFVQEGVPNNGGVISQFNLYGPDARVVELDIDGVQEIMDPTANERCAWWQKSLWY